MYDVRRVLKSSTTLMSPLDHVRAPNKSGVLTALNTVAKKATLAYDTRVVETGAAIKALVDIRHPCPGVAAIMQLHRYSIV